jgi:four helix bundle protein
VYKNFRDFKVWEKSHDLVKDIYNTKFIFDESEKYGLYSQIKRAAVSVPANIAEGCERKNNREFVQFLYISKGSLSELEYYLLLCFELGFLSENDYRKLGDKCKEINKMLAGLISKIPV